MNLPFGFIEEIFAVMADCEQPVFQVLTKRSERPAEMASVLDWPGNVWIVSIEHTAGRSAGHLREVPAA